MSGFPSSEDVERHSLKCKDVEVAEEKWIKEKTWNEFKVTNRFTLTLAFKRYSGRNFPLTFLTSLDIEKDTRRRLRARKEKRVR